MAPDNQPPTGTVTFLFTDIEGSTALYENYPAQMQTALKHHDQTLRSTIEANEGYVFKTVGDAFCAAFSTAREALAATLASQRALFAEEWPENTELRVRVALHTGVADERDGDYFGPPVNRVARLLSAGHGGQILLSAATYNLTRDHLVHLEPKAKLRDLGEHRLKDLRYTEHIFQLLVPNLPKDFPPLRTHGVVTPSELSNLDRRYTRTRHISSGGMGEVYLVHHESLDRDVALKVLKNQYADDAQFVESFKREAKSVARLSHPNIVQVYDAGEGHFEGNKVSYIAMEYVSGGTLKDLVSQQRGPLPARTAVELTLQVAKALGVAHRQGVTHRDIKPQNILLTETGEAKVADFGIAKAATSSTSFTRTGLMMGTLHYISPEQADGQPASPRSDLYALGVVLYEMLTGELPFDADTPAGIMMKHITGQLRSLKEAHPEVPEGVNAVCMRLLAKNPNERYPDAAALIEDLEWVRDNPEWAPAPVDPNANHTASTTKGGSMAERAIRVLICDDHPIVRSGLRAVLRTQPNLEVVGEASDGVRAVALADQLRPDIVLMDLQMPEMDGVTAIEKIKAKHPEIRILVLTTYNTDADVLRAVEKGAAGFLLKETPEQHLFDAIKDAAEGKAPLAPAVATSLMKRLQGNNEGDLSERELDILRLVAQGLSNKEIAKKLLISGATVKAHMLHIFNKLGVDDRTAAVTTALKRGIIRLEP